MKIYELDYTDLFCGELNYSFIGRYTIRASSFQGAVTVFSKYINLNFRVYYKEAFEAIYWSKSKLSACIIQEKDLDNVEEFEWERIAINH